MGKYDPLGGHLRRQRRSRVEMSFAEIERVLGAMLPNAARRCDWWSNDADDNAVQRRAWLGNGYRACLMPRADRVRFERIEASRLAVQAGDLL